MTITPARMDAAAVDYDLIHSAGTPRNIEDLAIGKRARFQAYVDEKDGSTNVKIVEGVIEAHFREPPCEDRYQRLNYRVRLDDGTVETPYASECLLEGSEYW